MAAGPPLRAQQPVQPVTRAQAVAAALTRGAPAAFGRADTAAAAVALRAARLYPNPSLAASYTDMLFRMVQLRREVGESSELDVRLAEVNAGQLDNIAAYAVLAAVDALLAVQLAMGLPAATPTITLADSLVPPPPPLDS